MRPPRTSRPGLFALVLLAGASLSSCYFVSKIDRDEFSVGDCPIIIRPEGGGPFVDISYTSTAAASQKASVYFRAVQEGVVLAYTDSGGDVAEWKLEYKGTYRLDIATSDGVSADLTLNRAATGESVDVGGWTPDAAPYDKLGVDIGYEIPITLTGVGSTVIVWSSFHGGATKFAFYAP